MTCSSDLWAVEARVVLGLILNRQGENHGLDADCASSAILTEMFACLYSTSWQIYGEHRQMEIFAFRIMLAYSTLSVELKSFAIWY